MEVGREKKNFVCSKLKKDTRKTGAKLAVGHVANGQHRDRDVAMSGSGDEFGRAVAKIGVAQLCEAVGFNAVQRSAGETLADILIRYLTDLAKAAHFYANLAGRTQCNALDVIMAMEDVGTGPTSAAENNRPLSSSKALQEVMRYVEYSEEIPFARPLPHFPVSKKRAPPPSFAQLGETPPFPHIPAWLPAFPDPHTYKSTPVWNERKSDPRLDKLELARQRRKAERSLVSLHSRLSSTGAATPKLTLPPESHVSAPGENAIPTALATIRASVGISPSLASSAGVPSRQQWPPSSEQEAILSKLEAEGQAGKGKGKRVAAGQNPFLASPFQAGQKEVSKLPSPCTRVDEAGRPQEADGKVSLPSVLEAFAPAIEAAKQGKDSMDGGEGADSLPEAKDRQPVHLSFDWGKKARAKALAAQLSMGVLNRSPGKEKLKVTSQGRDEEKDDKKKRAEQILAQAMEAMEGADDVTQA
ncbi:hypothetical protein R1sor_025092 [Riccia sorocarpa]|uniref:Transcription initiation factor TFIID subunit 8 n=1 Tax=Riccia sorocarpa TaxID=122646 RepID=A0ABD3GBH5_9MARC